VTDVLVFDAPGDRANVLHLELPGSHFGGAGKLKIKIPRSMVVVKLGRRRRTRRSIKSCWRRP